MRVYLDNCCYNRPYDDQSQIYHVACSIMAKADYFITTDDRLLKYHTAEVDIVTPGEFIRRLEEKRNA